jgi:hypothetical protein
MKPVALVISLLALGFAASTAARADYAVVMFKKDGSCKPWLESSYKPLEPGWKYHWVGLKSWDAAVGKKHYAMTHHWCKAFGTSQF